jgi:tetratricopeptide (TPR) repeat protein
MERSEVGTFILTPLAGTQAVAVSVTSLAAPKKARSSFDKAVKELSKGPSARADKAIGDLEKTVMLYPEYAAAWAILGQTRSLAGDSEGAIEALERAVQSDSRYLRPYDTLARLTIAAGNWNRTMELADFVLKVNPTNNQMLWFKATSQFEMKSHDEAIASLTKLQSDEAGQKRYPQTHHVLGLIYADRGQFTEAASEYRRYLELAPDAPAGDRIKRQLYQWEQLGII